MTEDDIIRLFYSQQKVLHDCAHYPVSEKANHIVTTDSQVEDVHFTLDSFSGSDVAYRLFQVNLSDLCAQLGRPNWCVLNLGLPSKLLSPLTRFVHEFAAELKRQCKKYECPLIGGDTFRTLSPVFTSLTMSGTTNRKISRTCPSDISTAHVYVSGNLGKSYYGCEFAKLGASKKKKPQSGHTQQSKIFHMQDSKLPKFPKFPKFPKELKEKCIKKYIRPEARFDLSQSLEKNTSQKDLYALIDISDGLYMDAHRLIDANSGTLTIDLECLPVDPDLKNFATPEQIVSSGEELELLILGSSKLPNLLPIELTRIGRWQSSVPRTNGKAQAQVTFRKDDKPVTLQNQSFQHFS